MNRLESGSHIVNIQKKETIIPSEIVVNPLISEPDKILFINSNDSLDIFNKKFGYVSMLNRQGIDWIKVSKCFKGFGIYLKLSDKQLYAWLNNDIFDNFFLFTKSNMININELSDDNCSNNSSNDNSDENTDENSEEFEMDLLLYSILLSSIFKIFH